jgi:N,N-dimethylformamidase
MAANRSSPDPGITLEGYAEEVSVAAGSRARFMLSGAPGTADTSLVRMIHGDPHPDGPGIVEEAMDWLPLAEVQVAKQFLDIGSYVEIPDPDGSLVPPADFTLGLWVYPTLLNRLWHVIAGKWTDGHLSFGLFWGGHHTLTAAISTDGTATRWCSGRNYLWSERWQFVAITYRADSGDLLLYQVMPDAKAQAGHPAQPIAVARRRGAPGAVHASSSPLHFGAALDSSTGRHWGHFNGKIASPALIGEALDQESVAALAVNGVAPSQSSVLGAWDLSRDVDGWRVFDTSPGAHHGRAVNAPTRAVTGPHWSGELASLYADKPGLYSALHLHDDDLADAAWKPSLHVEIPAGSRSGIYALRVRRGHDRLTIPFVVRADAPTTDLALLLPTLTWQAYSSNRGRDAFTEDGLFDRGLCLYDVHADGSMVRYCTRRKPTRSYDPQLGLQWGAHKVTSSLYLIDWLEHCRISHDAVVDEDLHLRGADLLAPYRVVILGSHPEYWSLEMLSALRAYVDAGGRVLYLGGNGLYWVTSLNSELPYIMEVRKSGDGDFEDWSAPAPGELQHSSSPQSGGLWARRGLAPRSLLGVEHSANVFEDAKGRWGFRRLPASQDERYQFVFAGVEDEVIGDFGINLGSAAGFEMDSVQEWPWGGRAEPVVLARATSAAFIPPRRLPVTPVADLAITASPGGGAVFAAGSVTWTGSLSHGGYDNNVASVTLNVLQRFLTTPPGASVLTA